MQENIMVTDALNGVNSCLTKYSDMISQTENQQLRQHLIQMRNAAETSQYELFTIAKSKGYYEPAAEADSQDIQRVKSLVSSTGARM